MKISITIMLSICACLCANNQADKADCMTSPFIECISSYTNFYFRDDPEYTWYYSVFFFRVDNQEYFTITCEHFPFIKLIKEKQPEKDFNLYFLDSCLLDIYKNKVLIISEKDKGIPSLLKKCKKFLSQTGENDFPKDKILLYEGPLLPETYKYYQKDNKYIIEMLDSTILDFFPDDLIEDEKNWEKHYKEAKIPRRLKDYQKYRW